VSGWRVETVRELEELGAIREAWERLGPGEATADPEHFEIVLRHRPEAIRPHVVCLYRGDEPVSVVVGRIEDVELPARIGYRKIVSPRLRALTVVQGGVLGDVSEPAARELLSTLLQALADGEADVLRLRLLEVGSPLHQLARTMPSALCRQRSSRPSTRWQVEIPDSFDEFLRARSKSMRNNIRYYAKRLLTEYADRARVDYFHDGSDLERLYRDTTELAAKTYQQALGASFEDTPLRRALNELAIRRGWFRAYMLYLDDVPAAFWYATAYRGVIHTGFTGYDPAYRDLSIGTFVLGRLIEDACADPEISLLDHGFGDADYKRRLSDRSWLEEDVLVFSSSWKGVRANVSRTAVLGVGRLGRRALRGRSDSVRRVKRWWRDRLRSGPEQP
jgi:CelD/BcsL family acetyltransferase involved in cellulose biosynthesis